MRHALVISLLLAIAAPAAAQSSPVSPCPAAGYADCAVRAEAGLTSGVHLLRGASGVDVGRVRTFGAANLAALLAGSDSAVAHARRYTRAARRSTGLALVGGALFVAAAVVDLRDREVTDAGLALVGAGSLVGLGAAAQQLEAQRELSRAVWWYDRDLVSR